MGCQHSKCQVRREERGSGNVRDRKGNLWNWIGRKRRAMIKCVKPSDDGLSAATKSERAKPGRVLRKTKPSSAQKANCKRLGAGNQAEANTKKPENMKQGSNNNLIKKTVQVLTPSESLEEPTLELDDCAVDSYKQERTDLTRSNLSTPSIEVLAVTDSSSSSSDDFIPMIPVWEMRGRPDVDEDRNRLTSEQEVDEEGDEETTDTPQDEGNELPRHAEQQVTDRRGHDVRVPAEPVREWIAGDGTWQDERQEQMEELERDARTPNVTSSRRSAGQGSPEREENSRQEEQRAGRAFYEPLMMSEDSEESKEVEIQKKIREQKNAALRESLKEQVDKRQEEIRLQEERELKELLKIDKYAKAYREQRQKEEDERKMQEYLKKQGAVSEMIGDEEIRQLKYATIQRQMFEKEERFKKQEQLRAEEEERLKEEKERKEEERLTNYIERLRIRRQNEQRQKGEEERRQKEPSGILEEMERISQMRQREVRASQDQTQMRKMSDEMRQGQSSIDESNSEIGNPSTRRRTNELTDSIDDLLQRKVNRSHTLPLPQPDQRFSSVDTREDARTRQRVASTASEDLNNYTIRSFRYSAALTNSVQSLRVPTNSPQALGSQPSSSALSRPKTLTGQNNRPLQQPPTADNQRKKQTRPKGAIGERPPVPTAGRIPESARLFFQRQHRQ